MKTASISTVAFTPSAAAARKSPSAACSNPSPVDAEIRSRMVAEAAYYRAEARGFATGYELEDWLEAEAEIDQSFPPSALAPLQE